jgi:hypothetical protein
MPFLAIEKPEQIGLIPWMLHHTSSDIGEQHYNLAGSFQASHRYPKHVVSLTAKLKLEASAVDGSRPSTGCSAKQIGKSTSIRDFKASATEPYCPLGCEGREFSAMRSALISLHGIGRRSLAGGRLDPKGVSQVSYECRLAKNTFECALRNAVVWHS